MWVMTEHELIQQVDEYCEAAGLAPATLCRKAVGNSRLYKNLVEGKGCTLRVAAKLREFIADNPAPAGTDQMAAHFFPPENVSGPEQESAA